MIAVLLAGMLSGCAAIPGDEAEIYAAYQPIPRDVMGEPLLPPGATSAQKGTGP